MVFKILYLATPISITVDMRKKFVFMKLKIVIMQKPRMIAIFKSCLLPKVRLSVFLEGRYIGYQTLNRASDLGTNAILKEIGNKFKTYIF